MDCGEQTSEHCCVKIESVHFHVRHREVWRRIRQQQQRARRWSFKRARRQSFNIRCSLCNAFVACAGSESARHE